MLILERNSYSPFFSAIVIASLLMVNDLTLLLSLSLPVMRKLVLPPLISRESFTGAGFRTEITGGSLSLLSS